MHAITHVVVITDILTHKTLLRLCVFRQVGSMTVWKGHNAFVLI